MTSFLLSILIAPIALQAGAATLDPAPTDPAIADLSELPIEEATAPRCGVVFAIVEGAQTAGDARAAQFPDLKQNGGREYFVRAMAGLMERRGLGRDAALTLVGKEVERLSEDSFEGAFDLMPPCLLLLEAADLQ